MRAPLVLGWQGILAVARSSPPVTVRADCATIEPMSAPKKFHRVKGQDERHHRAFLLYAMQHPDQRSLRAVARAIRASDNSIRKWRGKEKWEELLGDPETCRYACDLYAELYHSKLGGADVSIIRDRLGAKYVPPGDEDKNEVARSVDLYEQLDRESELAKWNANTVRRNGRMERVLDGTLGTIGRALAKGELKVRPSDIGTVVRGYELLEKSEQRRLAMLPSTEGGEGVSPVATSQRVLQAEQRGEDVLAALTEDTKELLLIFETLQTHNAESNVIPFNSAKRFKSA